MKEFIWRLRERQEVIRLRREVDRIWERHARETSSLDKRSDELQRLDFDAAEASSGYLERIAKILERQIRFDAERYNVMIPQRHQTPEYWELYIDGDRYF